MLKTIVEIAGEAQQGLRCVTAEQAVNELEENDGLVIDVREPAEVEAKPTGLSINIPHGVLEIKVPEHCPDSDSPIYLHCASGGRASLAAEQLKRMGYSNVSVITCTLDTIRELG